MIFEFLRRLRGGAAIPPADRSAELKAAAERFGELLQAYSTYKGPDRVAPGDEAIDRAFAERLPANASEGATLSFLSDAASYLGERLRQSWAGGRWEEDERWGLHLKGIAGIDHARYFPLALAEKKRALGERLSVAGFLATLDRRLAAEKEKVREAVMVPEDWRGLQGVAAGEWARIRSEEFRLFWRRRFGASLPVNLVGVREVDGFLRSHYIVNLIPDADLVRAGFTWARWRRDCSGAIGISVRQRRWRRRRCTIPS